MAQVVEAMEKAGIDPAKIYAYRRTGLLPGAGNLRYLSRRDIAEWQAAIKEFDLRIPRNSNPLSGGRRGVSDDCPSPQKGKEEGEPVASPVHRPDYRQGHSRVR